jgi:Tol biopolymer transport system component
VNVANPNFARNSDRLVVQAALPGESSRNLWILDLADPANPQRLTSTEDRILPAWCDGDSRIVFNANFRGGSVLWSIDAASGADLRRLGDRDQRDAACRR